MVKTFVATVDDNPDICDSMKGLLEMTGENYEIEQFLSGQEFMQRLDNLKDEMDIAIVDIIMPDFNIIEAIEKIDKNFPLTYIIVASGDDDPKLITHLQNTYHIWGYVIKGTLSFPKDIVRLVGEAHRKVIIRKGFINE